MHATCDAKTCVKGKDGRQYDHGPAWNPEVVVAVAPSLIMSYPIVEAQ
jgi:hypothetical protein